MLLYFLCGNELDFPTLFHNCIDSPQIRSRAALAMPLLHFIFTPIELCSLRKALFHLDFRHYASSLFQLQSLPFYILSQQHSLPIYLVEGDDFMPISQTVTFLPPSTMSCFDISIVNDEVYEPTELFSIIISPVTPRVVVSQGTLTVVILDEDSKNRSM